MNATVEKPRVRFDFRTFSLMMLIAFVPMLAGTWWLFASYEDAYLDLTGKHLGDIAETAFHSVNGYLGNQIMVVAGLTEVPSLQEVVQTGNLDLKRDLEAVRKSIPKMETLWPTLSREAPQAKAILDNPASRFLRRYIETNKYYRDILVTDFFGRLVAATSKQTGYYFAREDWWKETYGDGVRGSVYISDTHYDPASKSYLMELAQPFVERDTGVVGVIKVVLNMQGIHALIASMQAGPGTSVSLIHAKGDVISALGYTSLTQSAYPGTLDILNAREKGRRYFLSTASTPTMYGLSQASFQQIYPHLNWIVFTAGKVSDVIGPLPQLRKYLLFLLGGVFFCVIIATLIISRVESKPIIEEDPHLEKL